MVVCEIHNLVSDDTDIVQPLVNKDGTVAECSAVPLRFILQDVVHVQHCAVYTRVSH